ncbi:ABC transporter ATP-binding protein [Rhodoligotrophos defluvii]|uniref:ABC transporter ATP-binding protein n=1 Tax=Rhodoligotrophos defluvii TaxID=2561934 RepID=UPI0010C9D6F6|nr:ABC transporter ATP-binding protein [Rhodoligotrophos defluvii]
MTETILSGRGVTKQFRGLTAIENIDFDIPAGVIYGLIGPNGAGKSTLFNLITGYYPLTAGEIRFRGQSIVNVATYKLNQRGIARAFQIAKPFPALTVRENVAVGAMFGRPDRADVDAVTREALRVAGIEDLADRTAEGLTVGNLRKLEIARALATRPSLLLADEPCAGLNPTETEQMLACLRNVRERGTTIWLVEHDMKAVTSICDRILVIDAGRKIAEGTPQEVVSDPAVIAAYLGTPEDAAPEEARHGN